MIELTPEEIKKQGWPGMRYTLHLEVFAQRIADLALAKLVNLTEVKGKILSLIEKAADQWDAYLLTNQVPAGMLTHSELATQISALLTAQVEAAKQEVERVIFEEIEALPNPYSTKIFPRDIEWAAKIEREHGLTDDEITGISGALCRLGFEVLMDEIKQLKESRYLPEEVKE